MKPAKLSKKTYHCYKVTMLILIYPWCHKTVGSNKIIWFSAGKFHIFVTLFRFPNLLSKGQKNESMAIQEKARGNNSMVPTSVLRPFIAAAKDYCPSCGSKQTVALWLRYRVQSVFCAFIVKSNTVVSFHRTTAMKRHLENDLLLFHQ
jgi:Zn ribbon nucleic-acid-binding protein